FTHNGLVNGTSYTYWVKAVNATGQESSPSGSFTAIPQVVAAPPPVVVPPPVVETPPSPVVSSYRYTDNGDGTVTDNRSGLIWLKNANCFNGYQYLEPAMQSAANLGNGQCGLSDGSTAGMWRLPTKDELKAMVDKSYERPALSNAAGTGQWTEGDAFLGVQTHWYWSSTPRSYPDGAWFVHLDDGFVSVGSKTGGTGYGWPVRVGH
ncbi:MAG: DUF1566 domain-containing protein, partial [Candidatus Parabeggiatoa sp.]|nr:DUF1566 domain-containing protein [Candidatus Parabeggiatoa sp.]